MSLERLTITLHCWPTRRPARRAPLPPGAARPADEATPTRRFALVDVALDGDDVRDVERFDFAIAEALVEVATRLSRVQTHRLADLRSLGYATRLEIHAIASSDAFDLTLPRELIVACERLGLSVQLTSDGASIDRDDEDDDAIPARESNRSRV